MCQQCDENNVLPASEATIKTMKYLWEDVCASIKVRHPSGTPVRFKVDPVQGEYDKRRLRIILDLANIPDSLSADLSRRTHDHFRMSAQVPYNYWPGKQAAGMYLLGMYLWYMDHESRELVTWKDQGYDDAARVACPHGVDSWGYSRAWKAKPSWQYQGDLAERQRRMYDPHNLGTKVAMRELVSRFVLPSQQDKFWAWQDPQAQKEYEDAVRAIDGVGRSDDSGRHAEAVPVASRDFVAKTGNYGYGGHGFKPTYADWEKVVKAESMNRLRGESGRLLYRFGDTKL